MAPPPISVFGKLSGDRLFRIDGGPLGSSKYNLVLEVTDFRGNAWSSDFTLSALKDSFEEMVPEADDLLAWLTALPSNKTVQLKEDGEEAWIKAELEDAEALRLPPSGSLRKVGAEDAGAISAGIALALFDDLHHAKLSGKGERGPIAQSGASQVQLSQQLGSPTKASPHKAARTSGITSASQSHRPDAEEAAAGSADPSDDERKPSQRSANDDVPEEQRHRVVRGRGRGRMPFGFGGRGKR